MSRELFEAWAPPACDWSQWAKPAPFIAKDIHSAFGRYAGQALNPSTIKPESDMAVILELPGAEAVAMAVSLAQQGFRPVPLINTTTGSNEAVGMGTILGELRAGAPIVNAAAIPDDAPPVFVLDTQREGHGYTRRPRTYDNRWMVFPQDFPSGNYMVARGIKRLLLLTRDANIRRDLMHVLRRWQDAGVKIYRELPGDGLLPVEVNVPKPSQFKLGWYRFLVAMGLRKNAAGGFGGWIPEPSQSSGSG